MTATTSSLRTRHGAMRQARSLASWIRSVVAFIGSRWSAFADSGQFGPGADQPMSRHTGARI